MKLKPLILFLLICSSVAAQNTFNYTDSVFYIGGKRLIHVNYDLDGGRLLEASKVVVDSVVKFMKDHPTFKVEIGSHTDPRGSVPHNMVLSRARAQSVVDYMRYKGVDSVRVVAKGYGATQTLPGCGAKDFAGMTDREQIQAVAIKDRRTEVTILEK